MKLRVPFRYCLSIFLSLYSIFTFGQSQVDSIISIKFPGETKTFKTADSTTSANGLYLNTDKESYIVVKSTIVKDGKEVKILPSDKNELANIYRRDIENQFPTMRKKGFSFKDSARINIDGYIAYKLKYIDTKTGSPGAESILLFLNGARYMVLYSEVSTYNEKNKDDFFNSFKIAHSKYIKQIADPEDDDSSVFSIVFNALVVIGVLIFFIRASKNQSRFGINLKRVYCPVCNTLQPRIRLAQNINQILYGGSTCPKCHTKLDKYGNIIN